MLQAYNDWMARLRDIAGDDPEDQFAAAYRIINDKPETVNDPGVGKWLEINASRIVEFLEARRK